MATFEFPKTDEEFAARVDNATQLLETIIEDPALLAQLPKEHRQKLMMAAGRVSKPDAKAKRQFNKEQRRRNKATRRAEEEAVLEETGIRKKRNEAVFQTPPPRELLEAQGERNTITGPPGGIGSQHCYVCKEENWFFRNCMCIFDICEMTQ